MKEFLLLIELDRVVKDSIADKIIQEMTLCRKTLSGADTGLKNLWEEICVQVQGQESFYWEVYEEAINNYVQSELEKQPAAIKELISYIEQVGDTSEDDAFTYLEASAINSVSNTILEKAGSYQNRNISAYLDEDFHEDEGDEDDDSENEDKIEE